ncbi:MAG: hypothetical protein AAFY71_24665 [Bacteroidota bacterium]
MLKIQSNFNPLIQIIHYICLAFFVISCNSGELGREDVLSQIENSSLFPFVETTPVSLEIINSRQLRPLIEKGYIGSRARGISMLHPITNRGKQYVLPSTRSSSNPELAVCLIEFDKITGIRYTSEQKNEAVIEITGIRKLITSVGEALTYNENSTIAISIQAIKYDDGWRLKDAELKERGISNFGSIPEIQFYTENEELNTMNAKLPSHEAEQLKKLERRLSSETGEYDGFIRKIYTVGEQKFLEIDFVQIKVGSDEGGFTNFEIINNNPKLRIFRLSKRTKILDGSNYTTQGGKIIFKSAGDSMLKEYSGNDKREKSWFFKYVNGVIIEMRTPYSE